MGTANAKADKIIKNKKNQNKTWQHHSLEIKAKNAKKRAHALKRILSNAMRGSRSKIFPGLDVGILI
jgi:hypothetical protein